MCILVSKDFVPFCKYIKRHLYPGNQGTHDKLNQIRQGKGNIRSGSLEKENKPKALKHILFQIIFTKNHFCVLDTLI